mgnify:CR=1 FL=1
MLIIFLILCFFVNIKYIYLNSIDKINDINFRKPRYSSSITNNISNAYKKNLIISVLTYYTWEIIAPFIESYAKSDFENSECVVFVYGITQSTINKIKSFGVIVYDIPEEFSSKNIIHCRWKIYEDYLVSNINKYNLVFSTDLRDVFFQKDLFKYYNGSQPFFGVALEEYVLSQEKTNKKWIIDAYGEDIFKEIQNNRIICLGTIFGTIDKVIEFSKLMWKQIDSKYSLEFNIVDQAVGNYLIYHDKMFKDCLIKSENKNGTIMTLGLLDRKQIYFDLDDNIVNGEGKVAAVIHQYDRIPQIVKKVIDKYCPEINYKKTNYNYIIILSLIFIILVLIIIIITLLYKDKLKKTYNILDKEKSIKNSNNKTYHLKDLVNNSME